MLPSINSLALEDLPINLLRRLHLDREVLNQRNEDNRPACAGFHSEALFDTTQGKKGDRSVPYDALITALDFCAECPMRALCGADGDRNREEGLWGGSYRRWVHKGRRRVYESIPLLDDILVPLKEVS